MKQFSYIVILWLAFLGFACVSVSTGVKSSKDKRAYSEDLSAFLPEDPVDSITLTGGGQKEQLEIDSALNIQVRLDSALDIVNTYNYETTSFIEGLVIQLYAGNNRSEAKETQMKVYRYFPDEDPKLIFDQPNYKVRMGSFYTHLEAYPAFRKVQRRFPKAILVPVRIPLAD